MFGEARIRLKELAGLCRRLSIGLNAGIDIRKVWSREVERAHGSTKRRYESIASGISRGTGMAEGVDRCGGFFPELFRAMTLVGERSGHMAEILRQMADQYEHQIKLRRTFISAIWWPMFQLGISIAVIGFLIWIMGMIAPPKQPGGPPTIDPLGFGLAGTSGLITYLTIVGSIGIVIALAVRAVMRGALWIRPVQRLILRVPKLGRAFQTLALARLAWTLHITQGAGMDLKESLRVSLRSTRNAEYSDTADAVWASIRRGTDLRDALAATAHYPRDFLDTIEVGEQSGQLVESLGRLANQYEEEARSALEILTRALGFLIWALVGAVIVMMIFRLFSFYVGQINALTGP